MDEKFWTLSPRSGLPQLLGGPGIGGGEGDGGMKYPARMQLNNNEDISWPEEEIMNDR
jgi:hypothetical protein